MGPLHYTSAEAHLTGDLNFKFFSYFVTKTLSDRCLVLNCPANLAKACLKLSQIVRRILGLSQCLEIVMCMMWCCLPRRKVGVHIAKLHPSEPQ